jgi:hypothetical protein
MYERLALFLQTTATIMEITNVSIGIEARGQKIIITVPLPQAVHYNCSVWFHYLLVYRN